MLIRSTSGGRAGSFSLGCHAAGTLACVLIGWDMGQLGERNVGWRPNRTRAYGLGDSNARASRGVSLINTLRDLGGTLSAGLKQNAAVFTAVGRGWCQATCHRSQAPFLNVGLDEHEAHLAEIDMDGTGTVGSNSWEQILRPIVVNHVLQFLPIAGEKYCARSRPVANTDDIALEQRWAVRCRCERLVKPTVTCRLVGDGGPVEA